jgi:hypothetical protein
MSDFYLSLISKLFIVQIQRARVSSFTCWEITKLFLLYNHFCRATNLQPDYKPQA